jgi:hypothetical protein
MTCGKCRVMAQNVVAGLANYFQIPDNGVLGGRRLQEILLGHTSRVGPYPRARLDGMLQVRHQT